MRGRAGPPGTPLDEPDIAAGPLRLDGGHGQTDVDPRPTAAIAADDHFLLLEFRPLVADAAAGQIEVRVDGTAIARFDARGYGPGTPLAVPLARYQGRRVKLEVAYLPADERQRIDWQALGVIDRITRVPWVTL